MKKKEAGKTISVVIWIFLLALAAYIVLKGLSLDKGTLEEVLVGDLEVVMVLEAFLGIIEGAVPF